MGNIPCPAEDVALLTSVARDICPFPSYNPRPHFVNLLSKNSSQHLRNHYAAVQNTLTPKQLEEFTQSLKTTFGREGRVTLGGVGIVALSLAILFDTFAKQATGEFVPESGLVPNLFIKNLGGYYPPQVFVASRYLRLVPYIANNPERMRAETIRCLKLVEKYKDLRDATEADPSVDITRINEAVVQLLHHHMQDHLVRITNSSSLDEDIEGHKNNKKKVVVQGNPTEAESVKAHAGKRRKRGFDFAHFSQNPEPFEYNFNCHPEAASKIYLTEVQKSNDTQMARERCQIDRISAPTLLHSAAFLDWMNVVFREILHPKNAVLTTQGEDFDLRANSLGKWTE